MTFQEINLRFNQNNQIKIKKLWLIDFKMHNRLLTVVLSFRSATYVSYRSARKVRKILSARITWAISRACISTQCMRYKQFEYILGNKMKEKHLFSFWVTILYCNVYTTWGNRNRSRKTFCISFKKNWSNLLSLFFKVKNSDPSLQRIKDAMLLLNLPQFVIKSVCRWELDLDIRFYAFFIEEMFRYFLWVNGVWVLKKFLWNLYLSATSNKTPL